MKKINIPSNIIPTSKQSLDNTSGPLLNSVDSKFFYFSLLAKVGFIISCASSPKTVPKENGYCNVEVEDCVDEDYVPMTHEDTLNMIANRASVERDPYNKKTIAILDETTCEYNETFDLTYKLGWVYDEDERKPYQIVNLKLVQNTGKSVMFVEAKMIDYSNLVVVRGPSEIVRTGAELILREEYTVIIPEMLSKDNHLGMRLYGSSLSGVAMTCEIEGLHVEAMNKLFSDMFAN